MSKHTPGPWELDTDGEMLFVVAANPKTSCQFAIARIEADETEWDAHLIAAAPELLEAVKLFVEWSGPPPKDASSFDSLRERAWMLAQAAIAKTEGRL